VKYLRGTIDLPLVLKGNAEGDVLWWVDASHAVHPDMKGHTGATMSMGHGSIYASSTKQKLVTRSSTECEVVGVYDAMPQMVWTCNFLKEQGVGDGGTKLLQDNMSAMLLEKNGRASSSKRTKHMDIRYFFIKDRIASGDITLEHCPTESHLR
jgi:hypothetical protein